MKFWIQFFAGFVLLVSCVWYTLFKIDPEILCKEHPKKEHTYICEPGSFEFDEENNVIKFFRLMKQQERRSQDAIYNNNRE